MNELDMLIANRESARAAAVAVHGTPNWWEGFPAGDPLTVAYHAAIDAENAARDRGLKSTEEIAYDAAEEAKEAAYIAAYDAFMAAWKAVSDANVHAYVDSFNRG